MVEPSADAPLVMRKLVHAAAGMVTNMITNSEAIATAVDFFMFSSLLSIRDADDDLGRHRGDTVSLITLP